MKKSLIMLALMTSVITIAQKKNGTVYEEHKAIDVVENFTKAFVAGDTTKLASMLTDDFKSYNGVSTKPDTKGTDKSKFLVNSLRWSNELDYFSITDFPDSYPDAIEYKKDNKDDLVWVQTWELLKGVHNVTGVKFTSPVHRLYIVTKDSKIKGQINYYNEQIFDELRHSFGNRKNGTIYNHHDNINTVRKAVYAFENGDLDKAIGAYREDAIFYNINDDVREPGTLEEVKKIRQTFLDNFEIVAIEMIGYPDYLEYEMDNGRSVLSWWNYHLIRKSDKKEIVMPMHMNDDFDADGKIISEFIYYNRTLLEK
ncbi:nuclear transport factor 2 family protein [Aurantibacter sp.]|uniref:nuclear transport factor 2 family protein n=1 Tax=Aurantibacter sp. TaxID=2807103 RepID=UPI003265AB0F